ncbi:hypothetical protein O181_121872 [Austropuccinia psidii MF-1]|uniref:Retrotransposon gag domain-containing protein n=1 Tax=Austropuccinia psidii MF-1 TaxID=1389203 RepID=A0A9Q3Q3U7_9BASI|nr:hypothetical protein [Austropuccinia psidii MF-1]
MKEGGHVSLYIADFRSLVSRIGDWGERALTHHFRNGLPSRILDQLASHPSRIDSLQDLMDVTLEPPKEMEATIQSNQMDVDKEEARPNPEVLSLQERHIWRWPEFSPFPKVCTHKP